MTVVRWHSKLQLEFNNQKMTPSIFFTIISKNQAFISAHVRWSIIHADANTFTGKQWIGYLNIWPLIFRGLTNQLTD